MVKLIIFEMNGKNQRFTIASALPYYGPIHIGHLAGAYLPADIYARYKRLCENDVALFVGVMNTVSQYQSKQNKKVWLNN